MLANRLLRTVKDLLLDYESYGVIALLVHAKQVLAQRDAQQTANYRAEASKVRGKATDILKHFQAREYPPDLRETLSRSKYKAALPENVATLLLRGLPDDQTIALSSSELAMYIATAENLRSELANLVQSLEKLGIQEVTVPDGLMSLDFLIP